MAYQYLTVERRDSVFIITLRKPPENRLNVACCQELIRAYHSIQAELGQDAEGAVVLTGSNAKFFTTVSFAAKRGEDSILISHRD
jgi:enoyl-CoA hydratase/carnithine racemase